MKTATISCRKSISAGRAEEKAVKGPTKNLKRKKEKPHVNPGKTRPLASRKKIISADSSLKCPRTGPSLNDVMGKKPNALRNIWVLFTMFRGYKFSKKKWLKEMVGQR